MIVFPNAKINIGLRIIGKRSDGYHDIETIFYPVRLSDALEFVVPVQPIIKTILKLRGKSYFPFLKIHLHKVIPVGAGLGGGSSDAACLLKVINRHFGLNFDKPALKALALELGSDCPFFVDCIPSLASGRGEILTPVKPVLSGFYLVLLNPGVGINTAEAYQNCLPGVPSTSLIQLIERPVIEWKEFITNDFEDFAVKKHPIIGRIKEGMYRSNAIFSLMSGSGSSVYGIFQKKPELQPKLRDLVIWEGVM
jgi:4-diphosphocytidyl-2-C-methyl-D-erythritol kinase